MKQFRLSTLMLLVVIAALTAALGMQARRLARSETELRAELARTARRSPNVQLYVPRKVNSGRNRSVVVVRTLVAEGPDGGQGGGK